MMHARAGKTLIELLVVITLLTVVMSMAATTLAALFRTKQRLSREAHDELVLSRLATRLRADAHQAIRCEAAPAFTLTLAGGETIHYAVEPAEITREVRRADVAIHRDAFPLPRETSAAFDREGESGGTLVRLTIRPLHTPGRASPIARPVTVEAALDLPLRLTGREGTP